MTKKFKRGYISKGWWNPITNRFVSNEYSIAITKVIQSDEFGKWEDIDEDEIDNFGGFATIEEAKKSLITEFKVKEIEMD